MAQGLEVRVPYCHHRLVQYAFNVPWAMKSYDGREKNLLRAAGARLVWRERVTCRDGVVQLGDRVAGLQAGLVGGALRGDRGGAVGAAVLGGGRAVAGVAHQDLGADLRVDRLALLDQVARDPLGLVDRDGEAQADA
ncbi:asparagine synthase-related protein, partial [Streptomyces rimosus]|uniref:asparagine synthase-related protein n=1 Tax=Streptomyces rimosus TaxID=1927 RepID=UPI00373AE38D